MLSDRDIREELEYGELTIGREDGDLAIQQSSVDHHLVASVEYGKDNGSVGGKYDGQRGLTGSRLWEEFQ